MQVNILEAKNQLSKLVQAVLDGEDVVIARNGQPMVRMVRVRAEVKRKSGSWAHLMTEAEVDAAFSPAADAAIAKPFEQSRIEPARGRTSRDASAARRSSRRA